MRDLRQRSSHFEFGENWLRFAEVVGEERIAEAIIGLERLFPGGELRGKRLLDIGCGSGLVMLAALRLGASEVIGVDIDENSVAASRQLLTRFAPDACWRASRASVFELDPTQWGEFDIVHSWGVLHHTGDMWRAVEMASRLVITGGLFAIALYRKTLFCGVWTVEKRVYSSMPAIVQAPVRWLYQGALLGRLLLARQNPIAYVRDYRKRRGMSWTHDLHDWLGGYPYESVLPDAVSVRLSALGFEMVRQYGPRTGGIGIFGSGGCNEYVARKGGAVLSHGGLASWSG